MKLEIPDGVIIDSITFSQERDSCVDKDQRLTLSLDDAGCGAFLVVRASRWSQDADRDDLGVFAKIGRQMCDSYDAVHHPKTK